MSTVSVAQTHCTDSGDPALRRLLLLGGDKPRPNVIKINRPRQFLHVSGANNPTKA